MPPPPKRRLGQHFLFDPTILNRIVDALDPRPTDTVLEIGPGLGSLTAVLSRRAGKLIAIERDRDLVPALRTRFPDASILEGDALTYDWGALAGEPFLVVGNIPYQLTSPLLDRALTPPLPTRIVFLVQREVAERLAAAPGTKAYGALTIGIRIAARVERLFTVPAGAFRPPPQVHSALIRLTPHPRPSIPGHELQRFRRLVVGLFGFRRKQMVRALRARLGWTAAQAAAALDTAGIATSARPDALEPEAFVRLFGALVDAGWQGD